MKKEKHTRKTMVKKPLYRQYWFWVLLMALLLTPGAGPSFSPSQTSRQTENAEPAFFSEKSVFQVSPEAGAFSISLAPLNVVLPFFPGEVRPLLLCKLRVTLDFWIP